MVHNPRHPRHRAVGAGRDASARGAGAAARTASASTSNRSRRRSAIARPSANRSPSAAGTRSSPAATASSATWCWRSSRCRAASGFEFDEKVVGGAVPRNYIGAVEEGVVDALLRGPLGFPGGRRAGDADRRLLSQRRLVRSRLPHRGAHRRLARRCRNAQPVLLEPIHMVEIVCPTEATAKINAILSGAARPDPRLRHPRGLARAGTASAP